MYLVHLSTYMFSSFVAETLRYILRQWECLLELVVAQQLVSLSLETYQLSIVRVWGADCFPRRERRFLISTL